MKCCSHCGHEVTNEAVVCDQCGWSIDNNSTQKQPTAEQIAKANDALRPETNGMCIAGFVLSFFSGIIGLILSIIGINQLNKQSTQKGRGLALAGIIIGIFQMLWRFVIIVIVANNAVHLGR